jgi:hypothetical protein
MKHIENNNVYMLGIDMKTNIKLEGHIGLWTVIDAIFYDGNFYGLLEHNKYGDETEYQVVILNRKDYREYWLICKGSEKEGSYYIPESRQLTGTWDDLITGLQDYGMLEDLSDEEAEKLYLSEKEINDTEVLF